MITHYSEGTERQEKPIMILAKDKVNVKSDCVEGSIGNGIGEQKLFSFNFNAPPGNKIRNVPTIVLYKKMNKIR